jgi:hypothetical protein
LALVGCPDGPKRWAGPIGPGGILVFSIFETTLEFYQIKINGKYL